MQWLKNLGQFALIVLKKIGHGLLGCLTFVAAAITVVLVSLFLLGTLYWGLVVIGLAIHTATCFAVPIADCNDAVNIGIIGIGTVGFIIIFINVAKEGILAAYDGSFGKMDKFSDSLK